MASTKQNKKTSIFKAFAWAVFAVHQGFISWLVITNFDNYYAVLASVVSFGLAVTAVAIVGAKLSKTFGK